MITAQQRIRIFSVFIFFCAIYGIIIVHLFCVQVKKHHFFAALAHKQYHISLTHTPARAAILDRHGHHLVTNKEQISAFIVPHDLTNPKMTHTFLKHYFPDALERLIAHPQTKCLFIKRRLTPEEIDLINDSGSPDIHLLKEHGRGYPAPAAAQVVGITDVDNKGILGIERSFNEQLTGKPSTHLLEKDARSHYYHFTKKTITEGHAGKPIQLTIDSDLQFLALEELKKTVAAFRAKEGTVLIMDPTNGDILTMVSFPIFDPNNLRSIAIAATKNHALTETYELGSVFKVFAALAALEEGVVTIDEPIDCLDKTTAFVEGRQINTWKAHGVIPFSHVIEQSNNIGIAKVAKRLDHKLYDHLIKLEFGKKTGIPLPGEQSGFVNPPHNWSKQSIISLSYGYEVRATLLQLARAFCVIANDGYCIEPRLIIDYEKQQLDSANQIRSISNIAFDRHCEEQGDVAIQWKNKNHLNDTLNHLDRRAFARDDEQREHIQIDKQNLNKRLYKESTITEIKNILRNTALHGTAKRTAIKGYDIMSKTGTANLLENGQYNSRKNIYTCAGIIEKGNYKRVIVTFIKESAIPNLFASQVSAPLFERIAEKLLIHDKQL